MLAHASAQKHCVHLRTLNLCAVYFCDSFCLRVTPVWSHAAAQKHPLIASSAVCLTSALRQPRTARPVMHRAYAAEWCITIEARPLRRCLRAARRVRQRVLSVARLLRLLHAGIRAPERSRWTTLTLRTQAARCAPQPSQARAAALEDCLALMLPRHNCAAHPRKGRHTAGTVSS